MIYTIEIRPLALADLQEAYLYYSVIKSDLGDDFLNELQMFLDKITINPFIYYYVKGNIRQGKIKRFPYDVVYEVRNDKVLVYSIFMAKQNPDKKRIS